MSLLGVLSTSSSGLESITRRLASVSQNVANAGTANYVRQSVSASSLATGGVRTGVATRNVDERLQADVFAAGGGAAGEDVRQQALAGIDAASGTPGGGQDLPGLLGTLRDAFSGLATDPSSEPQQRKVISQADALAAGVNRLAGAVSKARQGAQDAVVADVGTANSALRALGTLSDQIMKATVRGESTADLEDQRDAQMQTVAELTGARFLKQSNGDLLAVSGGTVLPIRASSGPLSITDAALGPDTPAAAVPALQVGGVSLGSPGLGGRIGANLALRDTELPALQAGLDGFAQSLASGFAAQGVALFTDASGAVPAAGTAGFAQTIGVSGAVRAAPSLLRDGSGAAGAAGSTAVVNAVLDNVLGSGAGTLMARATSLTTGTAGLATEAATRADTAQAVQTSLKAKLSAGTGVSVDSEMTEMVMLQNAYGANAKVMAATQEIWSQLIEMVR